MHLTCPNCGAEYEVADGLLPAAGRHVQCTACHTRWYAQGPERPVLSEDQILRRLETLPRPRPVAVPDPAPPVMLAPEPEPAHPPEPTGPPPVPEQLSDLHRQPEPTPPPTVLPRPPRPDHLGKPSLRPSARPAPPGEETARPKPRLDLGVATPPQARPSAPPPRSRFGSGLALALVLALVAFGAYRYHAEIAAAWPPAAPTLDAYAATVDDWRLALEARLAELRPDAAPPAGG